MLTIIRARLKVDRHALLLGEQAVVRPEPRAVLRVGAGVVGEAAHSDVPANCGQVSSVRMDDLPHALFALSAFNVDQEGEEEEARERRRG